MDATCAIQASIHVFSLVRKYVSRILGTYHSHRGFFIYKTFTASSLQHLSLQDHLLCTLLNGLLLTDHIWTVQLRQLRSLHPDASAEWMPEPAELPVRKMHFLQSQPYLHR